MTINSSGTSGYTAVKVNVTETALGSGDAFLMELIQAIAHESAYDNMLKKQ